MSEFTPTQGRYLSFIALYSASFGLAPSEAEIAEGLQVAGPSVNRMLKMLTQKGLIRRQAGVARSIELLVDPQAIPEWTGKIPTRVVMQRFLTGPRLVEHTPKPRTPDDKAAWLEPTKKSTVYRFKVVLDNTKPPIWRRIEVLDSSLAKLHEAIQTAMGWCNCHLHAFKIDGTIYEPQKSRLGYADPMEETYDGLNISHFVEEFGPKLKMKYWYDYGDDWWHTISLETVSEAEPGVDYPRCTAGARCCPPEDVGGVYGFYEYVQTIQDPQHAQHDEMLEWAGEFDPEAFDPLDATASMQIGLLSY